MKARFTNTIYHPLHFFNIITFSRISRLIGIPETHWEIEVWWSVLLSRWAPGLRGGTRAGFPLGICSAAGPSGFPDPPADRRTSGREVRCRDPHWDWTAGLSGLASQDWPQCTGSFPNLREQTQQAVSHRVTDANVAAFRSVACNLVPFSTWHFSSLVCVTAGPTDQTAIEHFLSPNCVSKQHVSLVPPV